MSRTHSNFVYPRKVRFQCTRCTLCCGDTKTRARHILMLKTEGESISRATSKPIEAFAHRIEEHEPYVYEMRKTENGKCMLLESNECTIYALRPLICRCYPFELRPVEDMKYLFSFTGECPGIGKGKFLEKVHFEELFRLAQDQLG